MDNDGEATAPPVTGRWMTTSTYNIYMVDTPKDGGDGANGDGTPRRDGNPGEDPPKHRRQRRRSKGRRSRESNMGTAKDDTPDNAEDLGDPTPAHQQDGLEGHEGQYNPEDPNDSEDSNYMPLSEEEVSLGAEDFIVPEDPSK